MKSVRVTISLPEGLLHEVDRRRSATEESRSEFFREAIEEWLRRELEGEANRRYVEGYLKHPETAEEIEAARQGAAATLASEPWT